MKRFPTATPLREPHDDEVSASYIELFFDLVFVFAITQLSNKLFNHLDLRGLLETAFLLLVVWWAWIYTTWTTNWMDPDLPSVRMMLIFTMLAGLLMTVAIPEAFGDRALLFASAYVAIQLIVNGFKVVFTPAGHRTEVVFRRIFIWYVWVSAIWISGAFIEGDARYAIWALALTADYAGPYYRYWNPWHGAGSTTDWRITPSHFVERFQLFVIIVLGESIVVTGVTASRLDLTVTVIAALVTALVGTVALWWLYFDEIAESALRYISAAADPGKLGRDAYTYGHIPIIAGIVVSAVGDRVVIQYPAHAPTVAQLLVIFGGPVLYLAGHTLFRWRMIGSVSPKRIAAMAVLALLGLAAAAASLRGDICALLATAVLLALIVWEYRPRAERDRRFSETVGAMAGGRELGDPTR